MVGEMGEEKMVSEIVDEIAAKIIENKLPHNCTFSPDNLDNIDQQFKEGIINIPSKKIKKEENNDLVKKFINKKERKSKIIINNDNIGLYLEQERNNNGGWNVFIKDLSVSDNPRMERKKFEDNYNEAEKYYSELFFKYQFNEIKKKSDKDKKIKNSELLSMAKDRRKRIWKENIIKGQIVGTVGGTGVAFFTSISYLFIGVPIPLLLPFTGALSAMGALVGMISGYLVGDSW